MGSKGSAHKITVQILLAIIDCGGFLVVKTLDAIIKNQKKQYHAVRYLNQKELVVTTDKDGEKVISVTGKGRDKILQLTLNEMKIKRPKKWDGKWRVVIFDIPEKRKGARRALKNQLDLLGFVAMQKSIYAHPFDCEEEINYLRQIYNIQPYVQIILADKIERAEKLKHKFNL